MQLRKIIIDSFRNLKKVELTAGEGFNLVLGRNAQGKSNFLEALYCLSLGKSYRTNREEDLINFESDYARLSGLFNEEGVEFSLEVTWNKSGSDLKKIIKFNSSPVSRLSEFIDKAPMVMLAPEDLGLIIGHPEERRKFLDLLCSRLYPTHAAILREYKKMLETRNRWLKIQASYRDKKLGEVLTEKMCEFGSDVLGHRLKVLDLIRPIFTGLYREIFKTEPPEIRYRSSVKDIRGRKRFEITQAFRRTMNELSQREHIRRFTLAGPHRDDFVLKKDSHLMKNYSSMGEVRSAAVILKMTEADVISRHSGREPIILIDDSLNEFDPERILLFLDYITGKRQVFYGVTEIPPGLDRDDKINIYEILEGNFI